ncbi:hypothetical protein [Methylobacterium sp. D54C]
MGSEHETSKAIEGALPTQNRIQKDRTQIKTTFYFTPTLHAALKRSALDRGLSLNNYVVRVLERDVALAGLTARTHDSLDTTANAEVIQGDQADLRAAIHALALRLEAVERMLGQEWGAASLAISSHRALTVQEVRAAVRDVLLKNRAPMQHRPLLDHLLQERGLILPGKDVSENLRTILVHPKSIGFRFLRGLGYWVDDLPIPDNRRL